MAQTEKPFKESHPIIYTVPVGFGGYLRQLRQYLNVTQARLAIKLKINQTAVSYMESRDDVLVSSLRDYVRALGGTIRITAHLRNIGEVEIFDSSKASRNALPRRRKRKRIWRDPWAAEV